jgi:hypothetical protein
MERGLLRHPGRAPHAGAAQEVHEHGLRLVVEVVGQGNHVAGDLPEDRVPRLARRGFQALARFADLYSVNGQRHFPGSAKLRAEPRPLVGIAREAVMDMHRGQLQPGKALQDVEQDDRIQAAGQADGNTQSSGPPLP